MPKLTVIQNNPVLHLDDKKVNLTVKNDGQIILKNTEVTKKLRVFGGTEVRIVYLTHLP